jgi:hypothetical protein
LRTPCVSITVPIMIRKPKISFIFKIALAKTTRDGVTCAVSGKEHHHGATQNGHRGGGTGRPQC